MNVLYAFTAAGLVGCAAYMVLSRNVVRILLGLSLMTTAVNLVLFQTGRNRSAQPPLIAEGETALTSAADPVPQALILTAIVIGMALTIMFTVLALRAHGGHGTLLSQEIRSAERLGDPFDEVVKR